MSLTDAAGLPLTLADRDAAAAWDRTVAGFLAHSAATLDHLAETLDKAPDFPLGWAAKGMFYLLLGRSELKPVAAEALARAERQRPPAQRIASAAMSRRWPPIWPGDPSRPPTGCSGAGAAPRGQPGDEAGAWHPLRPRRQ